MGQGKAHSFALLTQLSISLVSKSCSEIMCINELYMHLAGTEKCDVILTHINTSPCKESETLSTLGKAVSGEPSFSYAMTVTSDDVTRKMACLF